MHKSAKSAKSFLSKLALASALSLSALYITGCASAQEKQMAESIITALPTEVSGCSFIGLVDVAPRYTIEAARFDLNLKAAKMGATHVVENYAYAKLVNRFSLDMGIALSGRAYVCPQGLGPKLAAPKAFAKLPYDLPHPSVNYPDFGSGLF